MRVPYSLWLENRGSGWTRLSSVIIRKSRHIVETGLLFKYPPPPPVKGPRACVLKPTCLLYLCLEKALYTLVNCGGTTVVPIFDVHVVGIPDYTVP